MNGVQIPPTLNGLEDLAGFTFLACKTCVKEFVRMIQEEVWKAWGRCPMDIISLPLRFKMVLRPEDPSEVQHCVSAYTVLEMFLK